MIPARKGRSLAAAAMILGCLALAGCDDRPDVDFPPEPSIPRSADGPLKPEEVPAVRRYCYLISLNPDKVEEFDRLHKKIPLPVKEALHRAGIRNYTVYACLPKTEQFFAIRYFEYVGKGYEGDMALLERNPAFQAWRNKCEECEVPLDVPPDMGKWWTPGTEILHLD